MDGGREFRLRYASGEEVREGDRVRLDGGTRENVVVKIVRPGASGEYGWDLPQGGLLVEGPPYGLLAAPAPDEDFEFVSRGPVPPEWQTASAPPAKP